MVTVLLSWHSPCIQSFFVYLCLQNPRLEPSDQNAKIKNEMRHLWQIIMGLTATLRIKNIATGADYYGVELVVVLRGAFIPPKPL